MKKEIQGFNGKYVVDENGGIFSLHRQKYLAPYKNKDGYAVVGLWDKGKSVRKRVHQLVAGAFLVKGLAHTEINHKNGVKLDNRVENLEWCTHKENMVHASKLRNYAARGDKHGLSI